MLNKHVINLFFLALTVLGFVALSSQNAAAQSCTGSAGCCTSWEENCGPPGCGIGPFSPPCSCTTTCANTYSTGCSGFLAPECDTLPNWPAICQGGFYASCSAPVSTPPPSTPGPTSGPGPTAPPPSSCTEGDPFNGIANCGAVGRIDGAGSCGAGCLCCKIPSSGPCSLEWQGAPPDQMYVGDTASFRIFSRGSINNWQIHFRWNDKNNSFPRLGTFGKGAGQPYDGDCTPGTACNMTLTATSIGTADIYVWDEDGDWRTDDVLCQASKRITVLPAPPTCSVSGSGINATMGSTSNFTPTITSNNGSITNVAHTYVPATGTAAVSPATISTSPYSTILTPSSPGSGSLNVGVYMNGGATPTCTTNVPVVITSPPAYMEAADGDILTNGNLTSQLYNGNYLINRQTSTEGIAVYGGSLNLGTGTVSEPGWKSQNGGIGSTLSYAQLREQVPSDATVHQIGVGGAVNLNSLGSGGSPDSSGYAWYEAPGNTTINANYSIPSGRKVVIFIDGNVTIDGTVGITNPNNSFLMILASGNITITPTTGSLTATDSTSHLSGIFFSEGRFVSSSGQRRLNIRGSVIALSGVNLQRDSQSVNPSENFSFSPELMVNYPSSLGIKRAFWKEVAP